MRNKGISVFIMKTQDVSEHLIKHFDKVVYLVLYSIVFYTKLIKNRGGKKKCYIKVKKEY